MSCWLESKENTICSISKNHFIFTDSHSKFALDAVGSNEEHDKEKLDKLLHHLMEVDLITDGTVARDHPQLKVGIILV